MNFMDSKICVNLELADSSLEAEDLQAAARNLLKQIRAVDGVEEADLVAVTDVPDGAMALGGFLFVLVFVEAKSFGNGDEGIEWG